jgi:hypothetical protein
VENEEDGKVAKTVEDEEEVVLVEGEEGRLLAALGSMGLSVSIHATEPTRREDAAAVELGPLVGAAAAARVSVVFLLMVMASMAGGSK